MPGRNPCEPGCDCRKHTRTQFHNELIGRGVARAAAERRERHAANGGRAAR